MEERELIVDLIIIIGAATAGGVLASLLRLPAILGYLVAGLIVNQYIPGLDIDLSRVQDVAEIGVALLLFTLGVKFSFRRLAEVGRIAILGGGLQIALTVVLGLFVGLALGLDTRASLVLGYAMAISSTMVVLKLLEERNEHETLYGRVALGVLLVQDLVVVALMILITATAGETGVSLAGDLALAAGKALLLIGGAYVLGIYVAPRLLFRIAATGSRELFLLAALSLALGLAAGSYGLGLSVAFGAFLAGLVVSESEFNYQLLAEVLPLREVFATIFFVSMGMLIDPDVLVDDPGRVAAIVAALVAGKLVFTTGAVALLRLPLRTALLAGFALAQMGEFSFVLAQVALEEGVISSELNSAILMSALISIVLSPLLLGVAPRLIVWLDSRPVLARVIAGPVVAELGDEDELRNHVVVCGYGRIGRELVRDVVSRGFRCLVIEENPYLIEELARSGIPRIYGDAANPAVLAAAALDRARVMAVTLPDPNSARLLLPHARRINPQLDVIVRAQLIDDHETLTAAGATEVVQPEFEAGLEFVRHTLHRFGVDRTQVQAIVQRRRRDLYRRD